MLFTKCGSFIIIVIEVVLRSAAPWLVKEKTLTCLIKDVKIFNKMFNKRQLIKEVNVFMLLRCIKDYWKLEGGPGNGV